MCGNCVYVDKATSVSTGYTADNRYNYKCTYNTLIRVNKIRVYEWKSTSVGVFGVRMLGVPVLGVRMLGGL